MAFFLFFFTAQSIWLAFKAGGHKCHTTLSLLGALINKSSTTAHTKTQTMGIWLLSGARGSRVKEMKLEVWWVYCQRSGSYPALCYLRCYLVKSAALDHFLPIVTRLDYLSMQVITVHLLSPLPVSDHRRAPPSRLLSACRWRWDNQPCSSA